MSDSGRSVRRQGMRAAAPLALAVAGFGVPFGVLARAAGFDPVAAVVFSATTFAGSAQFAAVAVLEAGGSFAAAILAAAFLNSRYLPMGVSVAPAMTGGPLRRLVRAQLVVDESWAVAHTPAGIDLGRLVGAGVLLYASWVVGTAVGAVAAGVIADPEVLGLTPVLPAGLPLVAAAAAALVGLRGPQDAGGGRA